MAYKSISIRWGWGSTAVHMAEDYINGLWASLGTNFLDLNGSFLTCIYILSLAKRLDLTPNWKLIYEGYICLSQLYII